MISKDSVTLLILLNLEMNHTFPILCSSLITGNCLKPSLNYDSRNLFHPVAVKGRNLVCLLVDADTSVD